MCQVHVNKHRTIVDTVVNSLGFYVNFQIHHFIRRFWACPPHCETHLKDTEKSSKQGVSLNSLKMHLTDLW